MHRRRLTNTDELVTLRVRELVRREDVGDDRHDRRESGRAVDDARNPHGVPLPHEPGRRKGEERNVKQELQPDERLEPRDGGLGHEVVMVGLHVELLVDARGSQKRRGACRRFKSHIKGYLEIPREVLDIRYAVARGRHTQARM